MKNLGFAKIACRAAVLCVATAIVSPAQTFTRLAKFSGADGEGPSYGSLIQGIDGSFYGTTLGGGQNNGGTVFKITSNGKVNTVHSFGSQPGEGIVPYAGVLQGDNGTLYGTTFEGGINGNGTVYELVPSGQLITLHTFCSAPNCADGLDPIAGLTFATNGNLYGTTSQSVAGAVGTIFELATSGDLTTLFSTQEAGPNFGVLQALNGNFYGVNESGGGAHSDGSVFEIGSDGKYSTIFSFDERDGLTPNLPIQASDGNFYGTTQSGGASDSGTAYKLSATGEYTLLYSFCSQSNCFDGGRPQGSLVEGTDGNFYGVTTFGGSVALNGASGGYGTIFQLTPAGRLMTLHSFCLQGGVCADGAYPQAGLVQGTDGSFYGTTYGLTDCPGNCGTVFSLSMGLGSFVQARPNFGEVGRSVDILGNNLAGATSVTFNGVPAKFDVVSNTYIRATVPGGAATGVIQVTTPEGALSSNVGFQVLL
jgi:uncharacterized repeat protein (TIGR03803 family)